MKTSINNFLVLLCLCFIISQWESKYCQGLNYGQSNKHQPPPDPPFNTPPPPKNSPPIILEHPKSKITASSEPVTLNCKATGQPTPSIKWFVRVRTKSIDQPVETTSSNANSHRILLPDGSLFFLRSSEQEDAGIYWCEARNENGMAKSRNATLQIAFLGHTFPSDHRPPFLPFTEDNIPIFEGTLKSSLELPCTPPRGLPPPSVKWKRNGEFVDPALILADRNRVVITSDGHLKIRRLLSTDEGLYKCVASNLAGSRESKPLRLKVLRPPFFTQPPQNISILAGQTARLGCSADGEPVPEVSWTYQNKPVDVNYRDISLDDQNSLLFKRVLPHHSGIYICKATNKIGTVYAKAELFVQTLPEITQTPLELITTTPGSKVTLRCQAQGRPDPLVIWMREDERTFMLPGEATDTLEVNKDGDVIIREIYENMHLVCFIANEVGSDVARSKILVQDDSLELGVSMSASNKEPLKGGVIIGKVSGISPTSIRVSWHLEFPEDVQRVDGFYILYRQAGAPAMEITGFTSITVLHAAATSYAVNRLLPHTNYEFLVIPFQRGLAGKPSILHAARTQEIRPELAPTGLKWSQDNMEGSVEISWSDLPQEKYKGVASAYKVLILQHGQIASNLTVPSSQSSVILRNLEPEHFYQVKVAGSNSQGIGPYSRILEFRPERLPVAQSAGISATNSNEKDETKATAHVTSSLSNWLIPLIICFAVLTCILGGLLIYSKRNYHGIHTSPVNRSSHRHSIKLPSFSAGMLSLNKGAGKAGESRTVQKDFQLLSMGRKDKSKFNQDLEGRRRFNSEGSESDYAYIDRSTHSITGYLTRTKSKDRVSRNGEEDEEIRKAMLNLSPYATTDVMPRMLKKLRRDKMTANSSAINHRHSHIPSASQPLNVNSYMLHSYDQLNNPNMLQAHVSSDHIYAIVATPESRRVEVALKNRTHTPSNNNRLSVSSANSLITLESDAASKLPTPSLIEILPPPPIYPPPQKLAPNSLEFNNLTTDLTPCLVPPTNSSDNNNQKALGLRNEEGEDRFTSDLYSKVKKPPNEGQESKVAFNNNPTFSGGSTRRKKTTRKKLVNNNGSHKEAHQNGSNMNKVCDWKSMDDADDSYSSDSLLSSCDSDSFVKSNRKIKPDVIPLNPASSLDKNKKRDKSLPRRKTRGERDQQRKRSINNPLVTPTSPLPPSQASTPLKATPAPSLPPSLTTAPTPGQSSGSTRSQMFSKDAYDDGVEGVLLSTRAVRDAVRGQKHQ